MNTYVYICIYTSDKSPHTLPAGTAPCTLTISRLGDCIWVPRQADKTQRRQSYHISTRSMMRRAQTGTTWRSTGTD